MYRAGATRVPHIASAEPLRLECGDFVQVIRARRLPRASGEVGLEVVHVLAEIQHVRMEQEMMRKIRVWWTPVFNAEFI